MGKTEDDAIKLLRQTCEEVLTFLGGINLAEGSALERMARLKRLTDPHGAFDQLRDKLVKTLTATHHEALYGNMPGMRMYGLSVSMGHLSIASAILNKIAAEQGELSPVTDCAADHLKLAAEALRRSTR